MEYAKDSKERVPYEHYMALFQEADPVEISKKSDIPYDEKSKCFTIKLMNSVYHISWPEFNVTHEEDAIGYYPLEEMNSAKILIMRYLLEGCKVPSKGKFYTYRELPWGEVYQKQFHGRCILRLAFGFGNKLTQFASALEKLGGKKLKDGDCSYELEFLDGLFVRFIIWEADEEFPPSSQILFSDNFPVSSFSAEDLAVVGDIAIGTFKKLA